MSKKFWKAAGIRAIKTLCQTALAMIPTGIAISQIGWLEIVEVSLTACILSLLTSIATGLPEVNE